ncbi:MAG: LysM peptidoglycan-binding domain-containing protein [Desulfosudaceae bacterium]
MMDDMRKFKVFMGALIACNIILLVLVIVFAGGGSGDSPKNLAKLEGRLESLANRMANVESDQERIAALMQQSESLETMPSLASESVQELASRLRVVEKTLEDFQDQAAEQKERADQASASPPEESAGETPSSAPAEDKKPAGSKKPAEPAPETASGEAVSPSANAPAAYCTVKEGDTLYSIGQRHNVKPETLRRLNDLDSNTIQVGQKLRIQ